MVIFVYKIPDMSSNVIKAEIISNSTFSIGFPNLDIKDYMIRTNYLVQIDSVFKNGAEVAFIEGEEDAGKTTLCANYVKINDNSCISIFFNPHNDLDYVTKFYCSSFVEQARHILGDAEVDKLDYVDVEEYRKYLFALRKKFKNKKQKLTLIVDGLEERLESNELFIKDICSILPFGEEVFQIVISGSRSNFVKTVPNLKKHELSSFTLAGFGDLEIVKYLEIDDPSNKDLLELFKITKGLPGRLKTLKRIIKGKADYSLDDISESSSYSNWLELDCDSINLDDANTASIVSVITLSEHSFSVEDIAKICSIKIEEVNGFVNNCSIFDLIGGIVKVTSNSHKNYLSERVFGNKKKVDEMLINFYASDHGVTSMVELPKIHARLKEWGKVIEILDENYIPKIVEKSGSLKVVNDSLQLGVQASEKTQNHADLWRYSIQGSIVNELDNYLFWESEIRARIAIHDFSGAISLAETAVLRIDRLRLLALIAKRQKEQKKQVDEELVNLIKELYKITDLHTVGTKIYDIVADLLYAMPNMAIEIIENSSDENSEKNINDWIITKLSFAAIDSSFHDEENSGSSKKMEAVKSLNSPLVKKINKAISFLVGNYSSEKVLIEVNKLSDPVEKLRLLRLWLNNNKRNIKGIDSVVESALQALVASSSEDLITIDLLKELSNQLPFISNKESQRKLLNKFKSLEKDISELGLTKNKFIYQLNIFHTLYILGDRKWKATLNKIIDEVDSINDTLIKLDSLAEVYSKLKIISNEYIGQKNHRIYKQILDLSKTLFNETSNHYKIAEYLLKTVGKRNPVLGLKICEQINTCFRREMAKLLILEAYLDNGLKYVQIPLIKKIEDSLDQYYSRESLIIDVLERYSEAKSLHYNTIKDLFYYAERINKIKNKAKKLYANVLAYKIIAKNTSWKSRLSSSQEAIIYETWKSINSEWTKIDNGFMVCSDLAEISPDFAKRMFQESLELKQSSWIDSHVVAHTYIISIKIIIRAFSNLVKTKNDSKKSFSKLNELISRIPSEIEKLALWSEVGIDAIISENESLKKKVLNDHIIPLMDTVNVADFDLDQISACLVLVHYDNPELAYKYLQSLEKEFQEDVLAGICKFYLTKQSPFELYDDEINKYVCNYNDINKALKVIERIDVDNNLYHQVVHLTKAIISDKSGLSVIQKNEIADELNNIIDSKLPDKNNITHDGFKILSKLRVSKIRTKGIDHSLLWSQFIVDSEKINNPSDIIFVKSVLLEEIPFEKIKDNGKKIKSDLFTSIITELENMKVHYEFVQRVVDISSVMYNSDRKRWKEIVDKAFTLSHNLEENREVYESQKNIIDSMYRLEPEYAKKLIKSMEKDSNNENISKSLKSHYSNLELSKKIKNNEEIHDVEKDNARNMVRAIIPALRSLNSGKLTPKKLTQIGPYLSMGIKLPLHEIFPVYLYYLNNCSKTYRENKLQGKVAHLHVENFEEAVRGTEVIHLLSHRRKMSEKSNIQSYADNKFESNMAVNPGTREEALAYVKNWLYDSVKDYIIVVDPYFEKEDLEILKLIKEECDEDIEIDILGSRNGIKLNIEKEFKDYWKSISDEEAPFVNITFAWVPDKNNNTPFHDRWILTRDGGLRLGTSINSLGVSKESEISIMKPSESLNIEVISLKEYIRRRKKAVNNQRVAYKSFSL